MVEVYSWLVFGIIGVIMGVIAWIVDVLVEGLVLWKWQMTQAVLGSSVAGAWLVFLFLSVLFGGTAGALTVFVGPGAMGSGIAELMGYFNGINVVGLIGVRTLIVKILGTGLGVAAALAIGKEGPLAHIGACVGHLVLYMPFEFTKSFQNEQTKREVAAAGAAAGVSAAFGSPIGGSLFAYEISKPSTYWSFGLTWKIFFCSSLSTFTLNLLVCSFHGQDLSITNAGLIKFGEFDQNPYKLQDFPFFVILGSFGGLLGSFFIYANFELNAIRKRHLTTKWKKLGETICLTALTATVLFFTPKLLSMSCLEEDAASAAAEPIQYLCPEGMYNPTATLLFNPEGAVIKNFLSKSAVFSYETLLLFFIIWYVFTVITYGTFIPAGLFLPGILIGCALGRVGGLFIENYIVADIHPSTYAIIGAASVLAGYSRLSFSLAVIMLETTENVNLFLPIVFALFFSFGTGGLFIKSLYVNAIRAKGYPFLNEKVPMCNELIVAEQIMTVPVVTLKYKASVSDIYSNLTRQSADLNGFPVVNGRRQCVGLISRHSLLVILSNLGKLKPEEKSAVMKAKPVEIEMTDVAAKSRPAAVEKDQIYERLDETQRSEAVQATEDGKQSLSDRSGDAAHGRSSAGALNEADDDANRRLVVEDEAEAEHYQCHNHHAESSDEEGITEMDGSNGLTWSDFNVDFHSTVPDINSKRFGQIASINGDMVVDLRPFMAPRPFTVCEHDGLQKCLDQFRLMNVRQMPVLCEDDGSVVGIITRQDMFAFMSV